MIIPIPAVLSKDQVKQFRHYFDNAYWQDGTATAGAQVAGQKQNQQLDTDSSLAQQLGEALAAVSGRVQTRLN